MKKNHPELVQAWEKYMVQCVMGSIKRKKGGTDRVGKMLIWSEGNTHSAQALNGWLRTILLVYGDIGMEWKGLDCHLVNGEEYIFSRKEEM